jgi:ribosomal protein L37E
MAEKQQKILFRIDFRNKGNGVVVLKDFAYSTDGQEAEDLFRRRPKLWGEFSSPYISYNVVPDAQWISEHPEEYKLYLDQIETRKTKEIHKKEREKKRIEKSIMLENEQEVQDRVNCPRCNGRMNKDNDFCLDCGYPSEEMYKKQSWFIRSLYIEGKKNISKE